MCAAVNQAGGDVRRKNDKFEPFAYLPLDPRALSSKYAWFSLAGVPCNLLVHSYVLVVEACRGSKKSVSRFKDIVKAKRDFGGLKKNKK